MLHNEQNNYQSEIDNFKNKFSKFKNKRIILYGLGRYTATLLPCLNDFNIIGLMDREIENIGKQFFGLKVLSKEQAEKNADLIIINTSPNHWQKIFYRIHDIKIPVFYLDGTQAIYSEDYINDNNLSKIKEIKELTKKIQQYDCISFDVFDTVLLRKVYEPEDIFKITEERIKTELKIDIEFFNNRKTVAAKLAGTNYTFNELYKELGNLFSINDEVMQRIRCIELQTEEENIVARKEIVKIINELSPKKQIFFVSDMYLPSDFIKELLQNNGIKNVENIIVSCEVNKSKANGDIWAYVKKMCKSKSILHIGDNEITDIEIPKKFGIETFYIMSARDLLQNSSLAEISIMTNSTEKSLVTGLIVSKLFNNPFDLKKTKGRVTINSFEKLGYVFFGPLLLCFFTWLTNQVKERQLRRIVFFARDGYILQEDYKYLNSILPAFFDFQTEYLAISRKLVLSTSYKNKNDFELFFQTPYIGTLCDFFQNRFCMNLEKSEKHYNESVYLPQMANDVLKWSIPYKDEILKKIEEQKHNYQNYLSAKKITEEDALVDLWYRGHNQYYLSKLLGKHLTGFYFNSDFSNTNKCLENNTIIACFQTKDDITSDKSYLFKNNIFVEAFLTAPYGTICGIDNKGDFITEAPGKNQEFWNERKKINKGVQNFMRDFIKSAGNNFHFNSTLYVDCLFKQLFEQKLDITENIKKVFFYDNTFVRQGETRVFE